MKRHTTQLAIRLPENQLNFLREKSKKEKRSVSYLIRRMIDNEKKKEDKDMQKNKN